MTTAAPYIQYLETLEDDWTEAQEPLQELRKAAGMISQKVLQHSLSDDSEYVTAAEVLDIHSDAGGGNTVTTPAILNERHICSALEDSAPVDDFFNSLRQCASDVHTRIIVLQEGMYNLAMETMLFCHILGIELDLRPSHVSVLAQIPGLKLGPRSRYNEQDLPGFISFHDLTGSEDRGLEVAAYIGRRQLRGGQPHVGRSLHQTRLLSYPADDPQWLFT